MDKLILLLVVIQIKHLVIDWILQPPWMWKNKGIYGHYGGIAHAAFNALGTSICFLLITNNILLVLIVDFVTHYHIDWLKMSINRYKGWASSTHEEFWWLTGLDQFLHQATYIAILYLVT